MKKITERGALIVEASIIFPIMFLVIFVMLYTGNAYLQKCRVESIINQCALDAAAYCADPQLKTIESGKIPTLEGLEVYPYRQFSATGVGDLETEMEPQTNSSISSEKSTIPLATLLRLSSRISTPPMAAVICAE